MAQTNLMRADDIANGFNGVTERAYWRASLAGTRTNPEVHFNSRASMVCVSYSITAACFTVSFSKSSAAFGDFLASAYRSLEQIMAALVAAGLPFTMPAEECATLRMEYNPASKLATVHLAHRGESWLDAEPMPFKVPVRNNAESSLSPIDGL